MFYTRAASHTVDIGLFDRLGAPITTGTATAEISKDGAAYAASNGTVNHVDEELWTLTIATAEATCDRYRIRITHASLIAPVIITNQAAKYALPSDVTTQGNAIIAQGNSAWLTATGFATPTQLAAAIDAILGEDGDTLKDLSDQLDGVVGGAGGEGSYTGTLTVDDGDGNGLEGVTVCARRGGVLKASGTTDASGEITDWVFGAYTYDLAARISGYQPTTDTITVSADAWTKTISLTAISITSPEAASLCTVQFRVKLSDTAVSGAVCKAKLLGINQATDGTILSNAELSDTTDSEGVAELQLVQKGSILKGSGLYKISVEIDGKPVASVETTIPNQSTYLFEDLLGA
jgi:hypothetical protein